MKKTSVLAAVALTVMTLAAFAHEYTIGNLVLVHPHAKATLPGAPVSGGYLTIRNTGSEPDRLLGAEAAFAGKVEIHQMKMDGEIMQMRPVEGGLEIPAGGEVVLEPGGYHIMFMQMKQGLETGSRQKVTLTFEKAGAIEVEFAVEEMKPGGHDKMHKSGKGHDSTHAGMSEPDQAHIEALLKAEFDQEEAPLTVEPIVVEQDWAVAGWAQEGAGGRALLHKTEHGWSVLMCSGGAFRNADKLSQAGVPDTTARRIAEMLHRQEALLGPQKIALFDSFEGTVHIGAQGHH